MRGTTMVDEMEKASEGEHGASKTDDLMHREILAIGRETRKPDPEEVECLTVLAEGVLRFCVMPAMQMTMDAYIEAASTATAVRSSWDSIPRTIDGDDLTAEA